MAEFRQAAIILGSIFWSLSEDVTHAECLSLMDVNSVSLRTTVTIGNLYTPILRILNTCPYLITFSSLHLKMVIFICLFIGARYHVTL